MIEIKTHKELCKLHGEFVQVLYKNKWQVGRISVYKLGTKKYVYFCFTTYKGSKVSKLMLTQSFGHSKARLISLPSWQGNYENRMSLTRKILVEDKNNMNQKERDLEELEKMKERIAELENIIREPQGHPCVTPVTVGGNILFNKDKQYLHVNDNLYSVHNTYAMTDHRINFQWIPIRREDLKVRDTAYQTDSSNKDFSYKENVVKILNYTDYAYIGRDKMILISNVCWQYWYKLVPKT